MKTQTIIARKERPYVAALNALSGITPDAIITALDGFNSGFLRAAALIWETIEQRDDVVSCVAPKRKKAVSHHGWEIVMSEETAEAIAQKETLEQFYNNITATSVTEPDVTGGMSHLLRQMMDAAGKRYSIHELVWSRDAANGLTCEFRFCPLWWFESTSGRLRFLPNDTAMFGIPLEKAGWLVHVSDGVMRAASIAWMMKWWGLKDWAMFISRNGQPWVKGVSKAELHTPDWERLSDAVKDFSDTMATVISDGEAIDVINTAGNGNPPYEPFVDRMDRALARIWLGSDLGTLSRAQAVGASLQAESPETLASQDCAELAETLAKQVSTVVLEDKFGRKVKKLAYLRIRSDPRREVATDLAIDQFLATLGAPIGVRAILERYGRPLPGPAEKVINKNPPAVAPQAQTP